MDYKAAADYWVERDNESVKMPESDLLASIEAYVTANDTCALATATEGFIRCTPIEYIYHDGAFYIFTEGGLKFHALEKNKEVAIAVFDKFSGFNNLKGLQVTGTAEVILSDDNRYGEIAKVKGIKLENLKRINHYLHLIKITVSKFAFINSDFKKQGYSIRQMLIL